VEIKQELKQGWVILVICTCTLITAFGSGNSMPFIFKSVIDEFGWTREQASLLATLFFAPGAIVAIVVGRIIDQTDVKKSLIVVSVIGGLGMVGFLFTSNLITYYVPGIMMGISMAGTIVTVKTLIARTFDAGQGTATGLVYMGATFVGIGIPLLLATLIESFGWRITMASLSMGVWFITLPIIIFGLDESKLVPSDKEQSSKQDAEKTNLMKSFVNLAKEKRFWLIIIAITTVATVDQGLIQHTNLYLELDVGFDMSTIAPAISLMFFVGAIGRLLMGWTFDKLSTRGVSLAYMLLALTCLVALPINGLIILAVFMTLRGLAHAGVLLDSPVLGKHVYGKKNIGLIIGIFTAAISAGFALGPWIMGRMFEIYGSYSPAFILFTVMAMFAAAMLFWVEPSYWLAQRDREAVTPLDESLELSES